MLRSRFFFISVLVFWCLPASLAPAIALSQEDSVYNLVAEGRLKKNLDFWISIYSQYGTDQGLIHDSKYVEVVYDIIPAGPQNGKAIRKARERWKAVLLSLDRKEQELGGAAAFTGSQVGPSWPTWSEDERKVFELFRNVHEPRKFFKAAQRKRIRFQLGQKDQFRAGLIASGRYLRLMEEIFRREGIPVQLTRLPFVESSFNIQARSKVGASGIWQFMRSTGRLFLRIDDAVDERNDPIRATEAAAALLKVNYQSLGKWPLAVTAYNYGRKGMMRAVRLAGTEEIEALTQQYSGRTFGFASSNFYTELLAAIEVEKNAERHFGRLERDKPLEFFEVKIPDYVDMRDLVQLLKLDMGELKKLNPGLSGWVFSGVRLIPAGYRLRLPLQGDREAASRLFFSGYSAIPDVYKLRFQLKGTQPRKRLLKQLNES